MSQYKTLNAEYEERAPALLNKAFERIRSHWAEHGEVFGEEEAGKIQSGDVPGEYVPFPILIFQCALLQDTLDWASAFLPLIGHVLVFPIKLVLWVIFFTWFLGKMKGTMWKKMLLRAILGAIIEVIPYVNMVPTMTVLVLMAHYREKKIVVLMNEALEIMHQHKIHRPQSGRNTFELQSQPLL